MLKGHAYMLVNRKGEPVMSVNEALYLICVELGGQEIPGTLHQHEHTQVIVNVVLAPPGRFPTLPNNVTSTFTEDPAFPQDEAFQVALIKTLIVAMFDLSCQIEPEDLTSPAVPCKVCGVDLSREPHALGCEDRDE